MTRKARASPDRRHAAAASVETPSARAPRTLRGPGSHCALGRKNCFESSEVLRAADGEVPGQDLVANLEERGILPGRRSVTPVRWMRGCSAGGKSSDASGENAAASRGAVFAVGPQRRQRRRGVLAQLLIHELHPGPGTARQTGSARRAARWSARNAPCDRPAYSSPTRTGPRATTAPARPPTA